VALDQQQNWIHRFFELQHLPWLVTNSRLCQGDHGHEPDCTLISPPDLCDEQHQPIRTQSQSSIGILMLKLDKEPSGQAVIASKYLSLAINDLRVLEPNRPTLIDSAPSRCL
jgi:hypothetical protein